MATEGLVIYICALGMYINMAVTSISKFKIVGGVGGLFGWLLSLLFHAIESNLYIITKNQGQKKFQSIICIKSCSYGRRKHVCQSELYLS